MKKLSLSAMLLCLSLPMAHLTLSIQAKLTKQELNEKFLEACTNNEIEIAQECLKRGAYIDCQNSKGNTALIIASKHEYTLLAEFLINHDANLEIPNNLGETALICVSQNGNLTLAKLLLQHHANVNHADIRNNTALMYACNKNNTNLVKLLLAYGANVNHANDYNVTALIFAVAQGNLTITHLLIKNKAHVNHRNDSSGTALMLASKMGYFPIVKLLINHGANTIYTDYQNFTAYDYCDGTKDPALKHLLMTYQAIDLKKLQNTTTVIQDHVINTLKEENPQEMHESDADYQDRINKFVEGTEIEQIIKIQKAWVKDFKKAIAVYANNNKRHNHHLIEKNLHLSNFIFQTTPYNEQYNFTPELKEILQDPRFCKPLLDSLAETDEQKNYIQQLIKPSKQILKETTAATKIQALIRARQARKQLALQAKAAT